MISYVCIGTNDLAKAKEFYTKVTAVVGGKLLTENERSAGFGTDPRQPMLLVIEPFDKQPATAGNGTTISLAAGTKDNVEALYKAALEAGGTDEGAPGVRADRFYLGYVRDLDGNKLAFFALDR